MSARPGLEILDLRSTPLGELCLRRRGLLAQPGTVVTEVTLNGEFLMSSLYTESERALASLALDWHGGADLDILVGGLGLGYTAHAALRSSRVRKVTVIEVLAEVISWFEQDDLVPLAKSLRDEPRLRIERGDVFRLLNSAPRRLHDVILLDVDHSPGEHLDPRHRTFYDPRELERAGEHLKPEGVLAVWSSARDDAFAANLREIFPHVKTECIHWHNDLIDADQEDLIFLAK